jgi:protein SCO1
MNNKFTISAIIIAALAAGVMITRFSNSPQMTPPGSSPDFNLPNAELLDQNGAPVRFVRDIVDNRIIALNFIYTNCSTACPVLSAIFSKLQRLLGEKLKQEVRMVSLSINPVTDTPERLKAYAENFHPESGWVWLTGEKAQVDALLKALGVYSADFTNHTPVIIVGDPILGVWTRFNGFSSPEAIAAKIDELLLGRHEKF